MSRKIVATTSDPQAVLLPQELLDGMGVQKGDEVDISIVDRTLIVRPLDEAERARRIEAATAETLERRRSAYEELAKGSE